MYWYIFVDYKPYGKKFGLIRLQTTSTMRFVHNPRSSARHHDPLLHYPDESPPALAQSKGPFLSQFIQGRRGKKMAASTGLPRSPSPHKVIVPLLAVCVDRCGPQRAVSLLTAQLMSRLAVAEGSI